MGALDAKIEALGCSGSLKGFRLPSMMFRLPHMTNVVSCHCSYLAMTRFWDLMIEVLGSFHKSVGPNVDPK